MSIDTPPIPTRRRNLAFAIETTTGTPAALSAANGVSAVFDPSINFAAEDVEREGQGSLSPIAHAEGARAANIEFETEHVGAGSATVPDWAKLLRMCGCQVSGQTFSPVTGATESGTFGLYQGGRLKRASGCMGNGVLTLKRGQKGRWKWTLMGVQQPPADATQILPTYVTPVAPRVGGTFTIGGTTFRCPDLVFDMGNQVILREDMSAVDENGDPTGYRAAYIVTRKPTFKIAPEALPLSTKDWYSVYRNKTLSVLSVVTGSVVNNTMTLAAPKLQLITNPEDTDRNGLLADNLTFVPVRNTDAGDDEWSLLFG